MADILPLSMQSLKHHQYSNVVGLESPCLISVSTKVASSISQASEYILGVEGFADAKLQLQCSIHDRFVILDVKV